MPSPAYIRDPGLTELIRSKNYKQALRNVDKKLKKQVKDPELLTTKADLLLKNGDFHECHILCNSLLSPESTVTLPDAVTRLNYVVQTLCKRGINIPSAGIEGLWQRAVKNENTLSAKRDVADRWMEESISYSQWSLAAKAAALLAKLVPSDDLRSRKYFFWQIVAHYLSKPSSDVKDPRLIALGQMMACRMLEKAVLQTSKSDQPVASSGHTIAQRQEFELLRSIYMDSDRAAQFVAAIEEHKLGMFSPPAVDEWGTYASKLAALDTLGRSSESRKLGKIVLENARELNIAWKAEDWTYWGALLKTNDARRNSETQALATQFDDEDPKVRSPAIASISVHKNALSAETKVSSASGSRSERAKLLCSEAKSFYMRFSHQAGCASEMLELASSLPPALRSHLISCMQSHNREYSSSTPLVESQQQSWFRKEINAQKLDFSWRLCAASRVPERDEKIILIESLKAFVNTNLQLYRLSRHQSAAIPVKTIPPGDEACILAARALTRLWSLSGDCKYVVQAACLLTFLLEDSGYNADARMMLINIHLFLGLPALAIRVYEKLEVKSLLINSCAPLLFHRISTLLPFAVDKNDHYDLMTKHLKYYGDALAHIPRHQVTALDKENYAQAKDFDTFAQGLQDSVTRRMLATERRSVARLRRIPCNEDVMALQDFPPTAYSQSVHEGTSQSSPKNAWNKNLRDRLVLMEPPVLSDLSMNINGLTVDVLGLAAEDRTPTITDIRKCKDLRSLVASTLFEDTSPSIVTVWEKTRASCASSMANIVLILFEKETLDHQALEQGLRTLQATFSTVLSTQFIVPSDFLVSSEAWPLPRWQLCHQAFIQTELLSVGRSLASRVEKHCKTVLKLPSQILSALRKQTQELIDLVTFRDEDLQSNAAKWKRMALDQSQEDRLAERVLDMGGISDSIVGKAIEEIMGVRNSRRIIQSFASSSVATLDGILKVSIK